MLNYPSGYIEVYDGENFEWVKIEQKQLPISDESKQKLIDVRINIFNNDVDGLAEKLFVGDITVGNWEEKMKQLVRELRSSVAAISKGGWDQMTWEDWGRLGPGMKQQNKYLHEFAQKIADMRDTISLRAIQAQARMYGQSALKVSGEVVPLPIEKQLPWMPRAGDGTIGMKKGQGTVCRMRCCCGWVFRKTGSDGDFNIVEAKWVLSPAEHCETCIDRDGYVVMLRLYKTIEIPDHIGFYCEEKELVEKGGKGSGNFGHAGRPGEVGGSSINNDYSYDIIRDLGSGTVHSPQLVKVQGIDGEYVRKTYDTGIEADAIMYTPQAELASYRISQLLELDNVTKTFAEYDDISIKVTYQKFVDAASEPTKLRPIADDGIDQLANIVILDYVTGNGDRHMNNMMYDANGKLWAVDNDAGNGFSPLDTYRRFRDRLGDNYDLRGAIKKRIESKIKIWKAVTRSEFNTILDMPGLQDDDKSRYWDWFQELVDGSWDDGD